MGFNGGSIPWRQGIWAHGTRRPGFMDRPRGHSIYENSWWCPAVPAADLHFAHLGCRVTIEGSVLLLDFIAVLRSNTWCHLVISKNWPNCSNSCMLVFWWSLWKCLQAKTLDGISWPFFSLYYLPSIVMIRSWVQGKKKIEGVSDRVMSQWQSLWPAPSGSQGTLLEQERWREWEHAPVSQDCNRSCHASLSRRKLVNTALSKSNTMCIEGYESLLGLCWARTIGPFPPSSFQDQRSQFHLLSAIWQKNAFMNIHPSY